MRNWFKTLTKSRREARAFKRFDALARKGVLRVDNGKLIINKGGKHLHRNDESLIRMYEDIVYGCVSTNARNVSATPLKVYVQGTTSRFKMKSLSESQKQFVSKSNHFNDDEISLVPDHPLQKLLDYFNEHQIRENAMELTQAYMDLLGKAFWLIQRDALGVPESIYPLQAHRVKVVPDVNGYIKHFEFQRKNDKVIFQVADVIYFHYANPLDPIQGKSPLQAALGEVVLSDTEIVYQQALYDNNGSPDLLISSKTKISEPEEKRFLAKWMQKFGGAAKSGAPALLSGEVTVNKLGLTQRDMQTLVRKKFSREQICNMFDIPITQFEASKSRAETVAKEIAYKKNGLLPRLRIIEGTINKMLVPMFDVSGRLFVAFDNPVPEDIEIELQQRQDIRAERESNLNNYVTSINQEREKIGLDTVSWGDVPMMPMNIMPFGETPPAPQKQVSIKSFGKKDILFPLTWRERQFSKKLNKIFDSQRDEIIEKLVSLDKFPSSKATAESLFDQAKWNAILQREAGDDIEDWVILGGQKGNIEIGVAADFAVINPKTTEFLRNYKFKFASKVNATFEDNLRQILLASASNGDSIAQTRLLILEKLSDKKQKKRAQLIARTESNRAQTQGTIESWVQSGIVSEKRWLAFKDACPWCLEMDGKTISLTSDFFPKGSAFEVGIERADGETIDRSLSFGYEEISGPPLHPNCRCDIQAVVID